MENRTGTTLEGTADHPAADRPDVSGELEQPKLESTHDVKKKNMSGHNHPNNFGRLIPGCDGCARVMKRKQTAARVAPSEKAPIPEPPPEPKPEPRGVYITYEQLQQLMAGQISTQIEGLKEFAKELKKPDPEEVERRKAEKDRHEKRKQGRIAEIKIAEEAKANRMTLCGSVGHQKENGKSAVYLGQEFSDGFYHPFCHRCGQEFPLVKHAPGAA